MNILYLAVITSECCLIFLYHSLRNDVVYVGSLYLIKTYMYTAYFKYCRSTWTAFPSKELNSIYGVSGARICHVLNISFYELQVWLLFAMFALSIYGIYTTTTCHNGWNHLYTRYTVYPYYELKLLQWKEQQYIQDKYRLSILSKAKYNSLDKYHITLQNMGYIFIIFLPPYTCFSFTLFLGRRGVRIRNVR
jgi:hypothetical protein